MVLDPQEVTPSDGTQMLVAVGADGADGTHPFDCAGIAAGADGAGGVVCRMILLARVAHPLPRAKVSTSHHHHLPQSE